MCMDYNHNTNINNNNKKSLSSGDTEEKNLLMRRKFCLFHALFS